MAEYQNAEIQRARQVVRANVEVASHVPVTGPSAGEVQWGGTLRPPNNTGLEPGETYTLVLPGFSPAKIMITSEANPIDGVVDFKGVGQPPKAVRAKQAYRAE